MSVCNPDRAAAYALLTEYNESLNLIRHALAVEAVMRRFAKHYAASDQEKWGIVGLVHDLDYEKFPTEHCRKVREILSGREWPEEYIRAVESHGWGICSEVEPVSIMEKVLYTVDELTGLIAAAALVRPSRSILDLNLKSVRKKWKDKAFAAGVSREVIEEGARSLGMELDQVIEMTIEGMRQVAAEIGLKGNL
jgi:predicted hydrolase (HD superfamily)